ncbi:MAG: pimeloyl-ACP methyl ester carboxylesterase/AraC-like DNA-binding protein [Marinoscillum sp.]|jgi:pimeloyl-ACP methyl ester carboxylesterase/AraC-like DNA-binding protein
MKPSTQYTKSGSINIAFQVFGKGAIDLVYIPGWVSNIDLMWACPELVDFLNELGKIARVILFDKRGTGLSDRIVELSTLEERMDDIRAVMDAVDSKKAVLFGHSEGGSVSALFAATYPNRTISLITFGIFAKRKYAKDYPWAPTDTERQVVYDMIDKSWGSGDMNLKSLAPSKANDKVFMDWLANYFRSGASPSAAMVLTKMNTEVDIIDILGSIKVPTLIIQRTGDIDVKIEEGRFIAERIPEARFVELEGKDHLFWVGNTIKVIDEMKAFITNVQPEKSYQEQLFTIVAVRVIAGDDLRYQALAASLAAQYRGEIIYNDQKDVIALFQGPSKAVHCSIDLVSAAKSIDMELAVGIHIREGSLDEAHVIRGDAHDFINTMLMDSNPHQILVTQMVKNLLSGAGLVFKQKKTVAQTLNASSLLLYSVLNPTHSEKPNPTEVKVLPNRDSFLENVLQSIENHLSHEHFGVEKLCREIGVSERQLQRKLKAITNKSPNQLITSVRLHRAKELLNNSDFNIAEIAFKTGFSSPSYFSKCFKKEFGLSPTEL